MSKGNLSFKHGLHMQETILFYGYCGPLYAPLQQAYNHFLIFTRNWKEQFVLKCICLKISTLKKKTPTTPKMYLTGANIY